MSNYSYQKDDDYNPDGSLTPQGRESFRSLLGLSDEEIDRIESVNMRHVRVEREQAECEEEHKRYSEEWDRKTKAEIKAKQEERERLGIEPTFKILYSSPDRIDPKSLNPGQRRAYEMSGLTTEELLSQGYIDLDDLKNKDWEDDDNDSDNGWYVNPNPPPEIPF